MSGIVNNTGSVSGIIGTTVGTPSGVAGSAYFVGSCFGTEYFIHKK